MLKSDFKNNEEVLLRRYAAGGKFESVLEILNKNKHNFNFNINAQSSNGNTALHWACYKAMEKQAGYSREYSQIIRLLIQKGANYLLKNKNEKIPHDFLKQMVHDEHKSERSFSSNINETISCYLTLISSLLKIECMKIASSEELESELALETAFHVILDALKLFRFFPGESKDQESFTILSLACGISSEIIPLITYFQYFDKKINYIGIDNNSTIINDNKMRYASFENVEFICADASDLSEIKTKIPLYSIDLGILRNGDFTEHHGRKLIFSKIIDRIFPSLIKPNYPLLASFQTEYELNFCKTNTKILHNFKKFEPNNFCDVGRFCYFFAQYQNQTVVSNPDRFSVILNSDKPPQKRTLSASLKRLAL